MAELLYGRVVVDCPQCSFQCTQHTDDKEAAICAMTHDVHCEARIPVVVTADGTKFVLGHRDGIDRIRQELQEKWQ